MSKFQCLKCNHKFEMYYWEWIFNSPFHWLIWDKQTKRIRDKRLTKCPNCLEKSWITRQK
jgi:hypothetical protein